MHYETEIIAPLDGNGSIGVAYLRYDTGQRYNIGRSRVYREHPSMVRARSAAEALCREHKRQHFPLTTMTPVAT